MLNRVFYVAWSPSKASPGLLQPTVTHAAEGTYGGRSPRVDPVHEVRTLGRVVSEVTTAGLMTALELRKKQTNGVFWNVQDVAAEVMHQRRPAGLFKEETVRVLVVGPPAQVRRYVERWGTPAKLRGT